MRILILLCVVTFVAQCTALQLAQAEPPPLLVQAIAEAARFQGLDPAIALSIVQIESTFNPKALREEKHLKTFSVGLFQILHTTAKIEFGFRKSVKHLQDPETNIGIGVRYIARCMKNKTSLEWLACCYQAGFAAKPQFCARHDGVKNYLQKLKTTVPIWRLRLMDDAIEIDLRGV